MTWMNRLIVALLFLAIPSLTFAHTGPSYDVYTDGWGSMWGSWSWNVTTTETTQSFFKGTKSLEVTYNAQWAGFAPGAWDDNGNGGTYGFTVNGLGEYRHLTFAVYNVSNGGDLWFSASSQANVQGTVLRVMDYAETGTIPQGKWTWVRIPILDMGLGTSPDLAFSFFAIQSGTSGAVVRFDDMTFGNSVTFYEGIQSEKGPGVLLWNWSTNVSQVTSGGNTSLQVAPTGSWGGIQLQQVATHIRSVDHGALTFSFMKTNANQEIHVSLINTNNVVVGTIEVDSPYTTSTLTPVQANVWHRVAIPITHFFSGQVDLAGVAFESDVASTFSVDDVRLIQKLYFPGVSGTVNSPGSGGSFGDHWQGGYCSETGLTNKKLLHNGTDHASSVGNQVRAAYRGVVKYVGTAGTGWGNAIVIEHEDGLTTHYLHTDAISGVVVGSGVQESALIGNTSNISGAHLHFGIRVSDYQGSEDPENINYSIRGRLPEVACKTTASTDFQEQSFSYFYLNTTMFDW